ncbi:MAG: hypothetical protein KC900_01820 [Candidatus Omnitrophica bacterium]|nr:hypothetical protein [Candidatus Omnitrophota bacterium]
MSANNPQQRTWPVRPLWVFNGLLVAALLIAGLVMHGGETVEKSFPSYAKTSAAERGWLTPLTPPTATGIRLKYDLDTNHRILTFSYPGSFDVQLIQHCRQVTAGDIRRPVLTAGWWPKDLSGGSLPVTPRHSFYECRAENGFLALDARRNKAYFWSY